VKLFPHFLLVSLTFHLVVIVGLSFNFRSEPQVLSQPISFSFYEQTPTPRAQFKKNRVTHNNKIVSSEPMHSDLSQISLQNHFITENEKYLLQVQNKIKSRQIYPLISKKRKEEGLIKILIELHTDGSLHDLKVIEASPFEHLNQAAKNSIIESAPFGQFPAGLQSNSWSILVPIRFQLSRVQ
jgi:TonB family protein